MGRVKIPNIKSGDTLSASKFNEINDAFLNFEVDGENLAVEGIKQEKKPSTYPFSTSQRMRFSTETVTKRIDSPLVYFHDLDDLDTEVVASKVMEFDAGEVALELGEVILVRVNARIVHTDFGARTFFAGIPPTLGVQLRYRYVASEFETLTLEEKLRASKRAIGTKQLFSCAFSSKIPSDSGGDEGVFGIAVEAPGVTFTARRKDNRFDLITYLSDELYPTAHSAYDILDNNKMFFHRDWSYTTAYPLQITEELSGARRINFRLIGAAYNPAGDTPTPSDEFLSTGVYPDVTNGCSTVVYRGFDVRNISMSATRIRK